VNRVTGGGGSSSGRGGGGADGGGARVSHNGKGWRGGAGGATVCEPFGSVKGGGVRRARCKVCGHGTQCTHPPLSTHCPACSLHSTRARFSLQWRVHSPHHSPPHSPHHSPHHSPPHSPHHSPHHSPQHSCTLLTTVAGGLFSLTRVHCVCCQVCGPCKASDCGLCVPCRDKPKFGGRGTQKQACEGRRCARASPSP
jgi:hypothetical protein